MNIKKFKDSNFDFLLEFLNTLPDAIFLLDTRGVVKLINQKVLNVLGIEDAFEKLVNKNFDFLFPIGIIHDKIDQLLTSKFDDFIINNYRIKNQSFEVIGKRIVSGIIVVFHNTTLIEKANAQNTKFLIQGQESERHRLSKEIHDGIGPFLSSLKLNIDLLSRKTKEDITKAQLIEISSQLSEISKEVRQVSHDLMPSSLMDFGLIAGVENLIKRINSGTEVDITMYNQILESNDIFTKEQELNIFRIVQESLNNALKHAQCSQIDVHFKADKKSFKLTIIDDGIGLNKELKNTGIGLKNIRTRAKSLGGILELRSPINKGLSIKVKIPLNKKDD